MSDPKPMTEVLEGQDEWAERQQARCTETCPECARKFIRLCESGVCYECETRRKQIEDAVRTTLGEFMRRHWRSSFENFEVGCEGERTVLRETQRFAEGNRGQALLMTGRPGTGKTHLACSIIRYRLEHGPRAVRYTKLSDIFREIRASFDHRGESEEEVLRRIARPDLLVVDEVDKTGRSSWETGVILPDLVDMVYGAERDILVIANCDQDEIKKFLLPATADRLRGMMGGEKTLDFAWPSRRGGAPE